MKKRVLFVAAMAVMLSTLGFSQTDNDRFFTETDLDNLPPSDVMDQPIYYHIQVYSRTDKSGNTITFDVDETNIIQNEIEYIFYHRNFGYAFFVYATKGTADVVDASFGAILRFEWKGTDRKMLGVQIDKIVTRYLLTIPDEVAKLKATYNYRLRSIGR
jgi:hypothetical protein